MDPTQAIKARDISRMTASQDVAANSFKLSPGRLLAVIYRRRAHSDGENAKPRMCKFLNSFIFFWLKVFVFSYFMF